MKILTLSCFAILLFSCSAPPTTKEHFKVEHKGALKNMMHKGDLSAKADLTDLKKTAHLYALGALENLKGEILILDSKPFLSSVEEEKVKIEHSFNKKACLLVYASVLEWKTINIPLNIKSYEDLEVFIEKVAKENGINTEEPFPFLIEGKTTSFDWHVINWVDGDTEHSHEKHISSGPHGTLSNQNVVILGFYSNKHHAIFTHHTTNMHLHVKTKDNLIAGHLDGITLGKGMVLKLPVNN